MVVLTGGKEGRNEYCLTMAQYCPLPGQLLAIARQETTRREEKEARRRRNKKEKEEGEGRRRNKKEERRKKQEETRRRERKREKDYSRFYSSLFTKPPETPINTGVLRGEEWRGTLHHSSPLFTPLTVSQSQPPQKTKAGHHRRLDPVIIED